MIFLIIFAKNKQPKDPLPNIKKGAYLQTKIRPTFSTNLIK